MVSETLVTVGGALAAAAVSLSIREFHQLLLRQRGFASMTGIPAELPQEFDGYRVTTLKSSRHGRMIFLGTDGRRDVVIKTVSRDGRHRLDALRLLFNEAQYLTYLDGLSAPKLLSAGLHPVTHNPFLVREYLPGATLTDCIASRAAQQHPPTLGEALGFLRGLSKTLADLHGAGVVHRDLHPSNLVCSWTDDSHGSLSPENIALIDFEMAAAPADPAAGGVLGGVPGFIAPEAYWSRFVGPEADTYSVTMIGLYLATGRTSLVDNPHLESLPQPFRTWLADGLRMDPTARPSDSAKRGQSLARAIAKLGAEELTAPVPGWAELFESIPPSRTLQSVMTVVFTSDRAQAASLREIIYHYYRAQGGDDRALIDLVLKERSGMNRASSELHIRSRESTNRLRRLHEELEELIRERFELTDDEPAESGQSPVPAHLPAETTPVD